MATFFTKITLNDVCRKRKSFFQGSFTLDVGEMNIFKVFDFVLCRAYGIDNIVIYKEGKLFAEEVGGTLNGKRRTTPEQQVILHAFKVVFGIYEGKISLKKYASVKVDPGKTLAITTPTEDDKRGLLMKAFVS